MNASINSLDRFGLKVKNLNQEKGAPAQKAQICRELSQTRAFKS